MPTNYYESQLSTLYSAIQELTQIQEIVTEFETLFRAFDSLTRCTGKVSGNHCVHSTGHNCPYPDHHRPDGVAKGERIRAYIRSDAYFDITRAQLNETFYQRAISLSIKMIDLRTNARYAKPHQYSGFLTSMTKALDDLKGVAAEASVTMSLPLDGTTTQPTPAPSAVGGPS